ncbi:hypothetical protein AB0L75_25075 [Streptomyces sp. NPDC052101]|uniref:hypothetical protein n=1 Tax=Streptomyces sp. NPDC052101 TaxID=3155763 RepID=UPI00342F1F46
MPEISGIGAVNVEYSHFSVGEHRERGFERRESKPDFQTDEPVITVPGQLVVTSRLQQHTAPVVLAVNDQLDEAPGPTWDLVASVDYQPVYQGRMAAFDTMNGPARPARESVEVFGRQAEPGEPFVDLDPSRTYRAQVWSQGRSDSLERLNAATEHQEWDVPEGLEAYVIVFVPSGTQERPAPSETGSRRERMARTNGKPPLNMR